MAELAATGHAAAPALATVGQQAAELAAAAAPVVGPPLAHSAAVRPRCPIRLHFPPSRPFRSFSLPRVFSPSFQSEQPTRHLLSVQVAEAGASSVRAYCMPAMSHAADSAAAYWKVAAAAGAAVGAHASEAASAAYVAATPYATHIIIALHAIL